MAETEIALTTPASKWSWTGLNLTMTPLDAADGNKFLAKDDLLLIAQNTDAGPQTIEVTSQPLPTYGRIDHINQSLAAGELRIFRLTKVGWEDANGFILMPAGQSNLVQVAIIDMTD